MFPENFTLLQNEGYLMQGCFKSSLRGMRQVSNGEPGQFYSIFFNYVIGLERLLKIILMLDQWHEGREFPDNKKLKDEYGHKVDKLYQLARPLFPKYKVEWKTSWEFDEINNDLLIFLASFANGSRYFNLDQLTKAINKHGENPINPIYQWQRLFYRVYQKDNPKAESVITKPDVPEDAMSTRELTGHHVIMAATRPFMCWRLIQFVIPLQALLIAIREQIHDDDFKLNGADSDPSVPFMEEFLDFVCEDKTIIFESEDWP